MSATKIVDYGLGKALTRRWDHLRRTPYVAKDIFDFVRRIRASVNIDKRMLSFDISSLFTNVLLKFTIDLILDRLYPASAINCKDKLRTCQCKECHRRGEFRIVLEAATSDTQFMFDDRIFFQHNGVAMGTRLGPIIADVPMTELETTFMDCLEQEGVCEWHRYVRPHWGRHEHPRRTKHHQRLSSLDQIHLRSGRRWLTSILGRSSFSFPIEECLHHDHLPKADLHRPMTNWNSFVPFSYKKASVVSMIQQALFVCPTYSLLDIELKEVKYHSHLDGYPRGFVDTLIGIGLTE